MLSLAKIATLKNTVSQKATYMIQIKMYFVSEMKLHVSCCCKAVITLKAPTVEKWTVTVQMSSQHALLGIGNKGKARGNRNKGRGQQTIMFKKKRVRVRQRSVRNHFQGLCMLQQKKMHGQPCMSYWLAHYWCLELAGMLESRKIREVLLLSLKRRNQK